MNFTHFSTQDILQIKLPQKIPQVKLSKHGKTQFKEKLKLQIFIKVFKNCSAK